MPHKNYQAPGDREDRYNFQFREDSELNPYLLYKSWVISPVFFCESFFYSTFIGLYI